MGSPEIASSAFSGLIDVTHRRIGLHLPQLSRSHSQSLDSLSRSHLSALNSLSDLPLNLSISLSRLSLCVLVEQRRRRIEE
jgi:hypothetical protein